MFQRLTPAFPTPTEHRKQRMREESASIINLRQTVHAALAGQPDSSGGYHGQILPGTSQFVINLVAEELNHAGWHFQHDAEGNFVLRPKSR